MSQAGIVTSGGGGGGGELETLTGNTGGAISPISNNINVVGTGNITVSGNNLNATLTISDLQNAPNQYINLFDDFFAYSDSGPIGQLQWDSSAGGFVAGNSTNPGQARFDNNVNGAQILLADVSNTIASFNVGGGSQNLNFVFSVASLSTAMNNYTCHIGFTDTEIETPQAPTFGIYFRYNQAVNSGNWQLVTNDGALTTVVNTATAASTGFHNYGIQINAAGTSITFSIDGVTVGTPITTTIPSQSMAPAIASIMSAGGAPAHTVDLFYFTKNLTVSR